MNKVPHFLRVTRTLALVSGLAAPVIVECGGETTSVDAGYDGSLLGVRDTGAFDGTHLGITDSGIANIDSGYDGAAVGDQTIDAGSDG
jgi:hypothetical protein